MLNGKMQQSHVKFSCEICSKNVQTILISFFSFLNLKDADDIFKAFDIGQEARWYRCIFVMFDWLVSNKTTTV